MEKKLYVSPQMEVIKITSKPLMGNSQVEQGENNGNPDSRRSWNDED